MTRRVASACAITCVIFAVNVLGRPLQRTPDQSTNTDHKPAASLSAALQMLTPTKVVDFRSYLDRLFLTVKRNWFANVPEEVKTGSKGRVTVRFRIAKDGTLVDRSLTVDVSSGTKTLDDAAIAAIRTSTPFEHLPEAFKGRNIELRFVFFYNLPLSSL